MQKNNKWDQCFLEIAQAASKLSKDPSTQCGAVIIDRNRRIISTGYNGLPRGVPDDDAVLNSREKKYKRVIHAEINALLFAHQDLSDCVIYVYPVPPCAQCTAAIIQSGIREIVTIEAGGDFAARWNDDLIAAREMCADAGVAIRILRQ